MPKHHTAEAVYLWIPEALADITVWSAISRLGFVSHRHQLKTMRASIVLRDRTVSWAGGELKRMDLIFVSSAASVFELSANIGSSRRQACSRTYSQHNKWTCFRISCEIRICCCINDCTTGTTKRTWEDEFSLLFSTNNATCDRVAMAKGIVDLIAGAHQRRFSYVVPAGSKERIARRKMASGLRLTRSLSTEFHRKPYTLIHASLLPRFS